jgi:CPA2 family monovalent cation:H+ antiporter-2
MPRSQNTSDACDYLDKGITDIYRETLDTSVRLGVDVLVRLGFRRYSALRSGQNFIRYDEAALCRLAPHRHDERDFISSFREEIENQEQLLTSDREINPAMNDHAWDSDVLRDEFQNRG